MCMRFAAIVLFLSFTTLVLASQEGLPPFLVTSIDVEPVGGDAPKNRVKFHALIQGTTDDNEAVILRDIVETDEYVRRGYKRYPVFHATKINTAEFYIRRRIRSPLQSSRLLLCVHGFNVQPKSFLQQVAQLKLQNYLAIPVIWPCEDQGIRGYLTDRQNVVPGASQALASLLHFGTGLFSKSILCHSMGNFVLKTVAEEAVERSQSNPIFENIFMVAADVRFDLFSKTYNSKAQGKEDAAPPILQLANKHVYVLHSNKDKALWARRLQNNGIKALGQDGCNKENLSDASKRRIFNKNCNWFNIGTGFAAHGYQFKDEAIQIYENPTPVDN